MICLNFDIQSVAEFLNKWQSLSGAFMGAFIPISFVLFLRWRDARNDFLMGISKTKLFLVNSINELYALKGDLNLFCDRIIKQRKAIEEKFGNSFVTDATNFPLRKIGYDKNRKSINLKSVYLANNIINCYMLVKDINNFISEIREEYHFLKDKNFDIALSNKINEETQNRERINQLKEIEKTIKEIILKIDIDTKPFLSAKIILHKYYFKKTGYLTRIYYEGFFGKKVLTTKGKALLDQKIEKEVDIEYEKLEKIYNGRIKNN